MNSIDAAPLFIGGWGTLPADDSTRATMFKDCPRAQNAIMEYFAGVLCHVRLAPKADKLGGAPFVR